MFFLGDKHGLIKFRRGEGQNIIKKHQLNIEKIGEVNKAKIGEVNEAN